MKINFNAAKPIYLQIIEEIKKGISRGELKPGDKIPSQRDMAKITQVNPNTVQRAYREMEIMGLVETLRGKGTFIKEDGKMVQQIREEMAGEAIKQFISKMKGLGFERNEIIRLLNKNLNES